MATKKFKMTGFARFFIVMLILAPLAYMGASYANGEDGIENLKNLFKGKISMGSGASEKANTQDETTKSVELPVQDTPKSNIDQSEIEARDLKIKALTESNQKLQEELNQTREELNQTREELEEVKTQLKAIKDLMSSE